MGQDNVNHPSHYADTRIETIDYIEDKLTAEEYRGYLAGNVLKYISRYRKKGGAEDLKKGRWYLDRLITKVEDSDGEQLYEGQGQR
jgi:hypothetical protein